MSGLDAFRTFRKPEPEPEPAPDDEQPRRMTRDQVKLAAKIRDRYQRVNRDAWRTVAVERGVPRHEWVPDLLSFQTFGVLIGLLETRAPNAEIHVDPVGWWCIDEHRHEVPGVAAAMALMALPEDEHD